MQKYLALLEQHVQWIAIGLGAAFVLYMTYAFVLTPPAAVEISGQSLGPSEVDPYTVDHAVKPLEAEINRSGTVSLAVPNPVVEFVNSMEWKNARRVEMSSLSWASKPWDVLLPSTTPPGGTTPAPGTVGPGGVTPPAVAGAVVELPKLPAPTVAAAGESRFGRSVVLPALENGQAPPAPAADQPVVGGIEKGWVTQLFKINIADIESAFKAAGVPRELANSTCFLQVEMERVEVGAEGKPVAGTETIVPPLGVWRTAPPPPFPADNATRVEQSAYLQWATANTPDIIQPVFHTTVPNKGDQWTKPGEVMQTELFNPATWVGGRGNLTDTQWQKVLDYRREQSRLKAEQSKQNRQPRTAPPPGGGFRGGPGGGFPGAGGALERSYAPAPPPRRPVPNRPPPAPPGFDGVMEGGGGFGALGVDGGMGGATVQAGLPQPGVDYPAGDFDPADPKWKAKPVEIWAHDDTVEAGKTYQYRARYKIRNPIFGAPNAAPAEKAQLADVFALPSEWSEWTSPLTMPQLVNFFVQSSKAPNSNIVRFDVFRWVDGQTKKETFPAGPGDQIGSVKGEVDFSTDWTVVDFRLDERQGNDPQILLVNNTDGSIVVRSFKADQGDGLYKQLKSQVDAQNQLEAANAGNGGAPALK